MTKNDAEKAIKIAAEIAAMEVITLMEISKAIAIEIYGSAWLDFVDDVYARVVTRYDDMLFDTISVIEQKYNVN